MRSEFPPILQMGKLRHIEGGKKVPNSHSWFITELGVNPGLVQDPWAGEVGLGSGPPNSRCRELVCLGLAWVRSEICSKGRVRV